MPTDRPDPRSPAEVRRTYGQALLTRAALHPAALGVLAIVLVVGFLLGFPAVASVGLAAVVYGATGGVLLASGPFRDEVLAGLRPAAPRALEPALPDRPLAMPVAQAYGAVRENAMKLRGLAGPGAVDEPEIVDEAERLIAHLTLGAQRATVLHDTLGGLDVAAIDRRIAVAEGDGDQGLLDAYRQQRRSAERCRQQLDAFFAECERAGVEVDTIRMDLAAASSLRSGEDSRQVAAALRGVREHAGTLVAGMEEAYRDRPSG